MALSAGEAPGYAAARTGVPGRFCDLQPAAAARYTMPDITNTRRVLTMWRAARYGGNVTALTSCQRNNFPVEVTQFIGRRRELPAIGEAIERHRLVTLRGPGRRKDTARAARGGRPARQLRGRLLAGPAVAAAGTGTPRAHRVRGARAARRGRGRRAQVLAQNLAERELLLLLDTCEHLTEACAELAALLLQAAPGLRILATSRAPSAWRPSTRW